MSGATGVAAGAAVVGAGASAYGASKAGGASAGGNKAAINEQRRQYDLNRSDQEPWRLQGTKAINALGAAWGGDMSGFHKSPNYEFVRSEGLRGIENSAAAKGGAFSGNALRGYSQFNTGLAEGEYNNWFNQGAQIAGVGQASAQSVGQMGTNAAGNIGNALIGAGDARASGIASGTNALVNGLNGGLQAYLNYRASLPQLQSGFGGTYYDYSGQGPGPWAN